MNQDTWSRVDHYFCDALLPDDPVLTAALADSDAAGLPSHHVAPNQGQLLHLFARMQGAKKILEIGTLAGYSTIWLARALPEGGQVVSLEANPRNAEVARINIERAGLSHLVDVRVGRAIDTLPLLADEGLAPFDLVFIDADKPSNPQYLDWSLKLARKGTVIIGDNVVRNGEVANPHSEDANVQGVRRFFELMAANPRLRATAIQTVGSKGYDGFSLAIVEG
ncbi:O-methyltransferase [Piscinibacter terrae]|uniref:O-methyltransferase n=1 Tax=Piscinibacter terrae TaxID=2496871 RepID=A0A3N7K280_9BURK|nr:O-methyltransferase [Albitalea terrae]RQP25045.1 O-methyltransferase [Albitalea terrae]